MKLLASLALTASAFIGSQAFACAMCLDIFTEVIVLDSATSTTLTTQSGELKSGGSLMLQEIRCTVQNRFLGNGSPASCELIGDVTASLTGPEALSLYGRIGVLTVEVDGSMDQTWVRTGERTGPIALVTETFTETTKSIPLIHIGTLSCPLVENVPRCEIELRVLNAVLLGK